MSASAGRSASAGLPEAAKGPAFATAVGLLIYPQVAGMESHAETRRRDCARRRQGPAGRFHRVGQWLRDSF